MKLILQVVAFISVLIPSVAFPQDFEAGLRAFQSEDYEIALKEWRPLAEQGYPTAQFNLGVMYEKGRGVPQDYMEAANWYRLASGQGIAPAQFNLGNLYYHGHGVPKDDAEAVRWYTLAAEQGNATAQFNIGVMYYNGDGVPQDYPTAHMWFNIALANGSENAGEQLDEIASRATAQDVSDAQKRARACIKSDYQDCD